MDDNIYNQKSTIGMFKENVKTLSNKPYYFDKRNTKFFGSKIDKVYSNKDNTKFVAYERLTNTYNNKTKYKILHYDYKKRELTSSKVFDSKEMADLKFNLVRKGVELKDKQ